MRVLPRNNDDVNEEWISDKTRFACDGLRTQRLDHPYVREAGKLRPASWDEALALVADKLTAAAPERIGAIAGDLAGAEEMFALKDLFGRLGAKSLDCRQDGAKLNPAQGRASYLFNATIAGIDQADAILLVGTNPRLEAAVLNARILKRWRQGGLKVGVIGEPAQLTYAYEYMGAGAQTLGELADGKHSFAQTLKGAQRPLVIVGSGVAARADGAALLGLAARIALGAVDGKDAAGWNPFNVLHTAASRVAGLDLGFVPGDGGLDVAGQLAAAGKGNLDVLYLLGADEIELPAGRQVLRRLPGPSRRPRRASRRCHPAGRRLHGEERHLRQHGGARADDRALRVPAGRGQGGLGDPARAVGQGRQDAALRHSRRAARRHVQGGPVAGAPQRGASRAARRRRGAGQGDRQRRR